MAFDSCRDDIVLCDTCILFDHFTRSNHSYTHTHRSMFGWKTTSWEKKKKTRRIKMLSSETLNSSFLIISVHNFTCTHMKSFNLIDLWEHWFCVRLLYEQNCNCVVRKRRRIISFKKGELDGLIKPTTKFVEWRIRNFETIKHRQKNERECE